MNGGTGGLAQSAAAAQHEARTILNEGRFHQPSVPRPLHGVLVAVGNALAAPLSAVESLINSLAADLPGGVAGVWAVAALVVVALTLWVTRRRARSTLGAGTSEREAHAAQRAAELERAALAAEREHRLEEAVRLRFRAGLARLSEHAAITGTPTATTSEISRQLASPRFDALARRFDEIAYGNSTATEQDVAEQRQEWPQILRSGTSR